MHSEYAVKTKEQSINLWQKHFKKKGGNDFKKEEERVLIRNIWSCYVCEGNQDQHNPEIIQI